MLITIPLSILFYKLRLTKLPYLPLTLWIEPTNHCNLRCLMCPNSIMSSKKKGYMSLSLYREIINQAKGHVSYIVLCKSGESLLHPKLPQMIKYAKNRGIYTYLATNATLLTPALSKKLIISGLDWVNFSFDGCTKEVYEKIRINANFEQTLQNMIDFLKIKKKLNSKIQTELQILIMNQHDQKIYEHHVSSFLKNFHNLPLDSVQVRQPSTWGGFFNKTSKFKPKPLGQIFSPCSYLWSALSILWDGQVVACSSDFFGTNVVGNIHQQNIKEIWNSPKLIAFRQSMLQNQYLKYNRYCQDCDSLWEKPILGLPSGIRGVVSISLNNILPFNVIRFSKILASKLSPNFAMKVINHH